MNKIILNCLCKITGKTKEDLLVEFIMHSIYQTQDNILLKIKFLLLRRVFKNVSTANFNKKILDKLNII